MTQFVASFALDLGTVAKIFPVIHLGQEYLQHSQKKPEMASDSQIMGWGRWCSPAYQAYTRLKLDQKESLFEKIASVLNS